MSRIGLAGWLKLIRKTPESRPVKRTSLGRFLREAAQVVIDKSGRVVVYSGDDALFRVHLPVGFRCSI